MHRVEAWLACVELPGENALCEPESASGGVHVARCGSDAGVGVCGRPSDMATGSRADVRSQGVHVVRCGSDVGVGVCGWPSDMATGSRAGVRSEGAHDARCSSDVGVDVRNRRSDVASVLRAGVSLRDRPSNMSSVPRSSVGSGSTSSVSARSSRASRIKESRVKVKLAQLVLHHEEERQREEEEACRREEARKEEKRKQAKREKQRQLEMANAELNAWETESACAAELFSKDVAITSHDLVGESTAAHSTRDILAASVFKSCDNNQRNAQVETNSKLLVGAEHGRASPYFCNKYGDVGEIGPLRSQKMEQVFGFKGSQERQGTMQQPKQERFAGHEPCIDQPREVNYPYRGTRVPQVRPPAAFASGIPYSEVGERFLPKPAVEKFDGDPLDYWIFVNRFKVHTADRVYSDDLKLVYRLQHCSKRVYERIQHYAGGPDKHHCYKMVWTELYQRYGQPYIISSHCEQRLQELPKVSLYDPDNLERMAVLMKRCIAALDEYPEYTTMNTVGFISSLAEKLPLDLRRKWVSQALKIQNTCGCSAHFSDFADFIINESLEANSTFCKAIFSSKSSRYDGQGAKPRRGTALAATVPKETAAPDEAKATTSSSKIREEPKKGITSAGCYCCGQQHKLTQCNEFGSKSFKERRSVVRDNHLCYRCLRPGHGIKDCRSKITCEVESCKSSGHHTLLHKEPALVGASDGANGGFSGNTVRVSNQLGGAASRPRGGAALDILPVRVSGGDVEVMTYALLDPGSSMSFCESAFINELGLRGSGNVAETLLETLTTEQPKLLKSEAFSLDVKPLDSSHQLKISNVVMIDKIPVSPANRNVAHDLDQFEHLRGVT